MVRIGDTAAIMGTFTLLDGLLSAGVVSTLIATGAFIQKSKDNSLEIIALKQRVTDLEGDRPKIAALVIKVENVNEKINDLKEDMRVGFTDLKDLLHSRLVKEHSVGH